MIGIYDDKFIDFLKDNLGNAVIVKNKNIICRCPWCETNGSSKDHYHLYISLELPIFHCFKANCQISGNIKKLILKLIGIDISDKYVNEEEIKKSKNIYTKANPICKRYSIPPIDLNKYKNKVLYLEKRFNNNINLNILSMKNLIFDFSTFFSLNRISINDLNIRYLDNNFIGFLTDNHTMIICRNIDYTSKFSHYKIKLQKSNLIDYCKIVGEDESSNIVVLAEGIYDIYSEYLFNSLKIKEKINMYASVASGGYEHLIKSIVYNENIFRMNLIILSDSDFNINYYKKLKLYNKHIIKNLQIYYNKSGKDFNVLPIYPEQIFL